MSQSPLTTSPLFKKYGKRIVRSLSYAAKDIYTRILLMDKYEQRFVIGVMVVLLLLCVSPLMVLFPNDTTSSEQYIFLFRIQLIKSMIIILGGLVLTLARHLSTRTKNYIIEYIGFDRNHYLLSGLLMTIVLASVMSLGEMNTLLSDYTTMLRMHTMYYVIQIVLICLVAFCVYLVLHESQGGFTGHVMGYDPKKSSQHRDDDMQGLFENIKH